MLVARFFDGLAGSAFLSVAGGTVGDMFATHVSLVREADDIFSLTVIRNCHFP
jgi:hypothetical protein